MRLTNLPRYTRARGGGDLAVDDILRTARSWYVVLEVTPLPAPAASPIAGDPYTHRIRIAPISETTARAHRDATGSRLHAWTWDRRNVRRPGGKRPNRTRYG